MNELAEFAKNIAIGSPEDIIRREEDYYRALSRIVRYRNKEALTREMMNHLVNSDRNRILAEKKKADVLLQNILPEYMIEELKLKGKVRPIQHENAVVIITDFVGFSDISRYMSPNELLKELSIYFDEFERICTKHRIEKVKTIGDAFLAVGGLGGYKRTAKLDCILASLEMMEYTESKKKERIKDGDDAWGLRIAIHSGTLIAGVVGHTKIAFDIWGHTVNLASRIENIGEPGKITVSKSVYNDVRDYFDCAYIGMKELKGVGSHDLYTIDSIKKNLGDPQSMQTPGPNFKRLYHALEEGKHIMFSEGKYHISNPGRQGKQQPVLARE
ncbi:adenylate/guanylate cyclase domain-containing protein [Leptospira sanjuanensis]|uniref:adenylate/guanylate cyclase domain-containing protein n=1 Tax=Leptospira sanjuanensis TaxID=2879643 RepID=UPI001EE90D55|nr:adenylate/guanylate cyclase domain-containing protein [Leptospira sanjuanensis]MCG6168168.1 adenylate/guanylate cyclase domain-containing protein [Leptospira sanjuanensis]